MKSKRAKRIKTKYRTSRAHPHSRQARYEAKRVPMGNTQEYMLWAPSKR
jgi:hypothetical protein